MLWKIVAVFLCVVPLVLYMMRPSDTNWYLGVVSAFAAMIICAMQE